MPRMRDTVPIPNSIFVMSESCKCGSKRFKSRGGSDIECVACGEFFLGESREYDKNIDRFYDATWRYDPVPPDATNL